MALDAILNMIIEGKISSETAPDVDCVRRRRVEYEELCVPAAGGVIVNFLRN